MRLAGLPERLLGFRQALSINSSRVKGSSLAGILLVGIATARVGRHCLGGRGRGSATEVSGVGDAGNNWTGIIEGLGAMRPGEALVRRAT